MGPGLAAHRVGEAGALQRDRPVPPEQGLQRGQGWLYILSIFVSIYLSIFLYPSNYLYVPVLKELVGLASLHILVFNPKSFRHSQIIIA